jgi:ATP-dependent RNA helicase RhlE
MLDLGFKPQLKRIVTVLSKPRQTLLFSATIPFDLGALAWIDLNDPVRVDIGRSAVPPSRARQDVYLVEHQHKTPLLLSLIERDAGRMLVFTRTKHRTDRLARTVRNAGHPVERLHSDRSQSQRRAALQGFRCGRYRILIATDVAARGLDVPSVQRVINFDLPQTVEDYVHRVGRTARAAAIGHASSFAAPEERKQLSAIERHIGQQLSRQATDASATSTLSAKLHEKEANHAQANAHTPVLSRHLGNDSRDRRERQGRELVDQWGRIPRAFAQKRSAVRRRRRAG